MAGERIIEEMAEDIKELKGDVARIEYRFFGRLETLNRKYGLPLDFIPDHLVEALKHVPYRMISAPFCLPRYRLAFNVLGDKINTDEMNEVSGNPLRPEYHMR